MSELKGSEVPPSVQLVPPFSADFGKNVHIGEDVFINSGCRFQDQGGIEIGGGSLIGHNAVITTLNRDMAASRRAAMHPARVEIGRGVWFGANVTVLPGVKNRRRSRCRCCCRYRCNHHKGCPCRRNCSRSASKTTGHGSVGLISLRICKPSKSASSILFQRCSDIQLQGNIGTKLKSS